MYKQPATRYNPLPFKTSLQTSSSIPKPYHCATLSRILTSFKISILLTVSIHSPAQAQCSINSFVLNRPHLAHFKSCVLHSTENLCTHATNFSSIPNLSNNEPHI